MNTLEKEQEFKKWLEQGRYEKRTIESRITNCKTVIFINILKKEILKKSIDYLPIQLMI